jgi:hypothetical protein
MLAAALLRNAGPVSFCTAISCSNLVVSYAATSVDNNRLKTVRFLNDSTLAWYVPH